jgi:hypothetical protein
MSLLALCRGKAGQARQAGEGSNDMCGGLELHFGFREEGLLRICGEELLVSE